MLTQEELQDYCLAKEGAIKEYPFDETTVVFKVGNKMFALFDETASPIRLNLKCDPYYAQELRMMYPYVIGGYHMNKKHWNTIICDDNADKMLILQWIDNSYELVFDALPKKTQAFILSSFQH